MPFAEALMSKVMLLSMIMLLSVVTLSSVMFDPDVLVCTVACEIPRAILFKRRLAFCLALVWFMK